MLKKMGLVGESLVVPVRFKLRFPNIDVAVVAAHGMDRCGIEAHLAETHNLTLNEAREELADFLYIEELSRELLQD
jgi:hypothetical protein